VYYRKYYRRKYFIKKDLEDITKKIACSKPLVFYKGLPKSCSTDPAVNEQIVKTLMAKGLLNKQELAEYTNKVNEYQELLEPRRAFLQCATDAVTYHRYLKDNKERLETSVPTPDK